MIQQYAHTLSNTLFPHTIYDVAVTLRNSLEYKQEALALIDAYRAEDFIKKQGLLLQTKYTGNVEEFQRYIRGSRVQPDTSEDVVDIDEMLNYAAERVISRFLNQSYRKLDAIRARLSERHGMTLAEWRATYEEQVSFNQQHNAIEWAHDNIARIEAEFSPVWQSLRIRKESHAEALLIGYFGELFFNALKYRDPTQDQWLKMTFGEAHIADDNFLTSGWENPYNPEDDRHADSGGKGLSAIRNDLDMLNPKGTDKNLIIEQDTEHRIFQVTLYFIDDIFIPNPEIKF